MALFADAVTERKSVSVERIWDLMLNAGLKSSAGPVITRENAWKVSTAFACGRVISQGLAQVPFGLMQKTIVDGLTRIEAATKHALYDALAHQPNSWMSSFEFMELAGIHCAFAGNAYAWKNFQRGGYREFILLEPGRVTPRQLEDFSIVYDIKGRDGTTQTLAADMIWHIRGPGWNGVTGWDTLQIARDALGLSIALEESHARMHANGVKPSGIYSVDTVLDDKQHAKLERWIKKHAGVQNTGIPLILDNGATWLNQALNGVDAQHVETRRLQIEELCRFWGVMPIMVMSSDKAQTYASAEQMFIAHVVHTMGPWYRRIEQSVAVQLLTKEERQKGIYAKFTVAGLLRGSAKDRADYYAKALGGGGNHPWLTQDDVRELEDMNPMGGGAAVLQAPAGSSGAPPSDQPPAN